MALCIFWNEGKILTAKNIDRVKHEVFYRPVGGGIEFGEHSAAAAIREVKEELGLQITNPTYLGTLENIFTSHGRAGHELAQIYRADLPDKSWYVQDSITTMENPLKAHHMEWRPLEFFIKGEAPLYPTGLLDLLMQAFCTKPQQE